MKKKLMFGIVMAATTPIIPRVIRTSASVNPNFFCFISTCVAFSVKVNLIFALLNSSLLNTILSSSMSFFVKL